MGVRCPTCGVENERDALFCGQCGRELVVADVDPLIGEVVAGRYRVLRGLDEGGMSRVYVADQRLGRGSRDVALKVLKADISQDPGLSERFAREVELLGQLQHPNTVRIFDYGELPDGKPFMVMELVAGEPLSDVLAEEAPLPPERVEQIAIQIASALVEAHERGIIHRDLKPHNVMLGSAGPQKDFVKLLDFGIARRVRGHELERSITLRGTILGTPPYMAPEQFEGSMIDHRTDVYALGIMLYELYTGELPFDAASPMAWATQHLTVEPKPFEATAAGDQVPEHARRAVMHALAKNPDDRPQSVLDFLRELTGREADDSRLTFTGSGRLEVGPSSAPPPMAAPTEPVKPPSLPGARVPVGAFVVAGLVLVGLVVWVAVAVSGGAEEDELAVARDSGTFAPPDTQPAADTAPPAARHGFQSVHHVSNASDAQNALGTADGRAAALRRGGILTLELARGTSFEGDGTAEPDLFVEVLEGSGSFRLEISADHHQFETLLGRADESAAIDIDQATIERPRYVRLRCLGRDPVLLDSVEVATTVERTPTHEH